MLIALQQGGKLADANIAFTEVARGTLMPIRVASMGELLLILGSLLLFVNVAGLMIRLAWVRVKAFRNETAVLAQPAEVKA